MLLDIPNGKKHVLAESESEITEAKLRSIVDQYTEGTLEMQELRG